MKNEAICWLLVFVCSCQYEPDQSSVQDNRSITTIDLSDYEKHIVDTATVKSWKYIPLDNRYPIGKVDKIIVRNEKIYVLDRQTKSVFIFNTKGKILYVINEQGKGPGEYSFLNDLEVGENDDLYLLDVGFNKVLKYREGKFIEEFGFKFWTNSFARLQEGNFAFYQKNRKDNRGEVFKNNIIYWRKDGGNLKGYFPFRKLDLSSSFLVPPYKLHKSGDKIFYSPDFCDTVFTITKKEMAPDPALYFNFGKYSFSNFSYDEIKHLTSGKGLLDLLNKEVFRSINDIYEIPGYFVCSLEIGRQEFLFFFSKKTKKYFLKETVSFDKWDHLQPDIGPLATSDKELVGLISSQNLYELKRMWNTAGSNLKKNGQLNKMGFLDDYGKDEIINPVVIFYTIHGF